MNFIENESEQKLRGGYYTPQFLCDYLVKWAIRGDCKDILEPSCGDGAFFNALQKLSAEHLQIDACEIDEVEIEKAKLLVNEDLNVNFYLGDFLEFFLSSKNKLYDSIVGNPPFIRYQYLRGNTQKNAEMIFKKYNLKFTKHTNIWVSFVIASLALLKPNGRLAMVIPSEIINVMHAQPLRDFLLEECSRVLVIDPEEIWFEGTLQGVVLLLAEKKETIDKASFGVSICKAKKNNFIDINPNDLFKKSKYVSKEHIHGKWTYALLNEEERSALEYLTASGFFVPFKDIADVDVGIVTGANDFFLIDDVTVQKFNLSKYSYPMFGRSEHCLGVIYDKYQHDYNKKLGKPTNFLWIKSDESLSDKKVLDYIKSGEEQELNLRYKCRIRTPWYSVPSVYSSNIGMLKRSHDFPRLIYNKMNAFTTDTAYRIALKNDMAPDVFVEYFVNSVTALSAELEGRSYGGGVLELVPSEIEKILVPLVDNEFSGISELDAMFKQKIESRKILMSGDMKLHSNLNISFDILEIIHNAWSRLMCRRQRKSL
ncbi:Eco57I restriction-modification methylase domain-containing protein [Seleniivibrio woodruffii]|uniref:Eco57I restriction-modification methylase domain-containing protein n=1 Tax=Seleniivibrio woodruffii TaxID=1078050 RepID=UPI00240A2622|nr:N-6 DNA methylase [Seleniivibrio woodruffii]